MEIKHKLKGSWYIEYLDQNGNGMCVSEDGKVLSANFKGVQHELFKNTWRKVGKRGMVTKAFYEWEEKMENAIKKYEN